MAIELPDRRMRLEAFIALNDDASDAQQATRILQEHVKQKLLPHKYPRVIHFLPELPKTGTGKIDRQALLQLRRGYRLRWGNKPNTQAGELCQFHCQP